MGNIHEPRDVTQMMSTKNRKSCVYLTCALTFDLVSIDAWSPIDSE